MYHNNRHNYKHNYLIDTIILHIHTKDAYYYDTYLVSVAVCALYADGIEELLALGLVRAIASVEGLEEVLPAEAAYKH
jgi:hypothetical protein